MCVKPSLNDTIRLLCEKDTCCHCVAKCLPSVTSCLNFFLPYQLCCGFQWIALELYTLCPHISYPGRLLMDDVWNCPSFYLKKKKLLVASTYLGMHWTDLLKVYSHRNRKYMQTWLYFVNDFYFYILLQCVSLKYNYNMI